MSASISRLSNLPIEILEQILLHLPGQDIVKMEGVSRHFQELTHNLSTIRYKRDLFSAGLVENLRSPCDFVQRRRQCKEHERKWSNAGRVVKAVHKLPQELLSQQYSTIHGGGLIISCDNQNNNLDFLRIPPVTSRKPIERWSIPPFPFYPVAFAVYPPDLILAVVEEKERSFCIHFLNLMNGSPHTAPASNIAWEPPGEVHRFIVKVFAITGSRVMIFLHCRAAAWQDTTRIVVWDWKIGSLVLDLSSADWCALGGEYTTVAFLDEFRMMVLTPNAPVPGFTLFDTFVSRNHPVGSRRFCMPLRYRDWFPVLHIDSDMCFGTRDRDGPLATDPAQAVLVIKLVRSSESQGPLVVWMLVVRTQTLIERMHSVSADAPIPWEEWGRGAVVIEVPEHASVGRGPYPLVQGVHVIWVTTYTAPGDDGYPSPPRLCTFDFSRRGWSILPLLNEGGGTMRRASFEGGRQLLLQGDEGMAESGFKSLGDGKFMYLEIYSGLGSVEVWELI